MVSGARTLADRGLAVVVYGEGRVPGGQTSTRWKGEGYQPDHGAQYLTVSDEALVQRQVGHHLLQPDVSFSSCLRRLA